jgi:hypothetical protein
MDMSPFKISISEHGSPMSVVERLPAAWPVFPMKPLVNIEKAIENGHL